MRRITFSLIMLLAAAMVLAACGGSTAPAADNSSDDVAGAIGNAEETPAATVAASDSAEAATDTTEETSDSATGEATMDGGVVILPVVDPLTVEGDVVSAGSSTVFPLAEAVAEKFNSEGYAGTITIDSIGSGAGFERFCVAGETDVANASRPIKDEEIAGCEAIGRSPIEFRVGTDALAVVTNPENDWAADATVEELAAIFTAEKWSDVNADWPAEDILRYVPGTDSGTFDYFVEAVFEEDPEPLLSAPNTQFSEDDNVLVIGVEGSPYAVGFFGYAYYTENSGKLNILNIGGVEPSFESVEGGDYALARPLFIYSDAAIMSEKPQVAAYVNYFLSNVNDVIEEVGYFPSSDEALNAAKDKWSEAVGQ
ncbi:MAG: PstS family phosphate ABC transporter substrate-binding protein [Caldilineaceae bacterium]|nr:PstS family phosphate ABC transporter substrate-binding protein [Caldilineaceae bacterium]